jgi:hypothetical protein
MSETYKTDQSFFTYVKMPSSSWMGLEPIKQWFRETPVARYRLIDDRELENNFVNLKTVDDFYPGTKTFAVVLNPWARAVISYKLLQKLILESKNPKLNLYKLDSFDLYLANLKKMNMTDIYPNCWYNFTTQQKDWIEYKRDDGSLKTIDHILKLENLEEDFKIFQDYFMIKTPLKLRHSNEDINGYKDYYNSKTKKIIEKIFQKDIEYFKYSF